MKKLRKVLCFVLPLVLVVAVSIGIILPISLAAPSEPKEKKEAKMTTAYAGQVAFAAESTGAATAAKDYKGGAIFLEPESSYSMSGGTISEHQNTYGGAIYISNKATFTMTGGAITNNKASYGGAIYVEAGGKCYIRGGEIKGNKATAAPAIYVEEGGTLEVSGEAKIEDNKFPYKLSISAEKELMGGTYSGTQSSVELYTTTYGSYPQTYVGQAMSSTLENWFWTSKPAVIKSYTIRENNYNTTGVWPAYRYTDGELYVRGENYRYASGYTYKNGDSVPDNGEHVYVWFKVEPIKWFIMNYDAWKSGSEDVELYSAIVLTANIYFNASTSDGNSWETSYIRNWCNEKFYNEAFTDEERELISLTTVKNNVTNNFSTAESDGSGKDTQDHIYLKSLWEMFSGLFEPGNNYTAKRNIARLCAPSDFALSNFCSMDSSGPLTTPYREQGRANYWLRSAGSEVSYACLVYSYGSVAYNNVVGDSYVGVRPALRLDV